MPLMFKPQSDQEYSNPAGRDMERADAMPDT
jgi:hypothetical protein